MTHREKVDHFVEELARRGVGRYDSAPPGWRLAWAFGSKVPPPYFMRFDHLAITFGLFAAITFFLLMHFVIRPDLDWPIIMGGAVTMGPLFGYKLAEHFREKAKEFLLPPWEDYPRKGS